MERQANPAAILFPPPVNGKIANHRFASRMAGKIMGSEGPRHILFVAGMHRSGTSSLAGLYALMGADIGKSVMPAAPDNPKGFFENERIVLAHDDLLAAIGHSWDMDTPPSGWQQMTPASHAKSVLKRILAEEFDPQAPVWLVKDPRLCLLLPMWLDIAREEGRTVRLVVALRHPEEIAGSLQAREGMPFAHAVNLTSAYLQALLPALDGEAPRAVLYDALLAEPGKALERLNHAAGQIFEEPRVQQQAQARAFLSASLRNNAVRDAVSAAGALYARVIAGRGAVVDTETLRSYLNALGELEPAVTDKNEQDAYIRKLQLVRTRRNLQYKHASTSAAKGEPALETRMLENSLQLTEYLLASAQEDFRKSDKERASEQKKNAALEKQLRETLARNKELAEKTADLEATIMRGVERPFRAAVKNVLWGTARLGWRLTPLTQNQRNALFSRFGSRITGIMPGLKHLTPQFSSDLVAPLSEAEITEPDFTFPYVPEADVSIIIPVYNQVAYTVRCLKSLASHVTKCTFEVIVMDDVSSDRTPEIITKIDGVRYVRNEENLGFLRNCNKAAGLAKGNYLVFLNNDTVVLPGWLDALYDTFSQFPSVGLVGSKLIFPDGRLQEAGGIVWNDASGWNWGRLSSPDHPRFNYVRDADYVSGASIMIERQLFEVLGRFDERYVPAYYEDTDLAFAVRDKGYRVIYQPRSAVVHFEGVSSGTDLNAGVKRYQVVNQTKFRDKWQLVLATHGRPEDSPARSADRRFAKHVLIVDAVTPTPDQDSGSVDMLNLIRILLDLGWRVHFIPQTNYGHAGRYTEDLQRLGAECIYFPPYRSLDHYLEENGSLFGMAILCREPIAKSTFETVRRHLPDAPIVFYTVDLHYLRTERHAQLTNDPAIAADAAAVKASELALMRKSDMTILLSEFERDLVAREAPGAATAVLPLIRDIPGRKGGYQDRRDVVFIGGFNHPPNIDAVEWLVGEIWPLVRTKLRGAKLKICGSNMPQKLRELCAPHDDIEAVGFIADLADVFDNCRLSIAPLRFGAGLKGKLATSFGYGVPCIATGVAVEGMSPEYLEACRLQGDTPEALADLIVRYYASEADWMRVSEASLKYVERHFSYGVIKGRVKTIIDRLEAPQDLRAQEVDAA
jgi:GT2 family glycosyltransferase